MAVYRIKEGDKAVSGRGPHVAKLLWIYGCFNVKVNPVKGQVFICKAGDGGDGDCDWCYII